MNALFSQDLRFAEHIEYCTLAMKQWKGRENTSKGRLRHS
jgi:hypothetical protein